MKTKIHEAHKPVTPPALPESDDLTPEEIERARAAISVINVQGPESISRATRALLRSQS